MPELTRRRLLTSAGAAATAALAAEFLPGNVRRALASGPQHGAGRLSDIKHVVILMQENRSFDHYFGTLSGVRGFADKQALTWQNGNGIFKQPDSSRTDLGYLLPYNLTDQTDANPSSAARRI